MPECYRCGAEEQLSLKYTTTAGNKKYLCRSCRREDNQNYKKWKQPKSKSIMTNKKSQEWNARAMETIDRLSKKYSNV